MTDIARLIAVLEGLAREGATLMDLVRAGQPAEPWRLYPGEAGIFDRRTRCQFYYHAHGDGRDEDGHFHMMRLFHDRTVHLVALSMAPDGWPRALFTVNQWAVGDAYEPAARVKAYVRKFRIDESRGPAPLVRFVNLMFSVFRPDIEHLQDEKIAALAVHRLRHPTRDPFEDRSLEILSWIDIDLRRLTAVPAASR
ncbi:MAG: DUF6969 family protein [Candidatus Rokuibacteriota bacterium]